MSQDMVPRAQWMQSVTETKKAKIEVRGVGCQSRLAEQSVVVFATRLRDAIKTRNFGKSGSETYMEESH